jgi:hypothetical protein
VGASDAELRPQKPISVRNPHPASPGGGGAGDGRVRKWIVQCIDDACVVRRKPIDAPGRGKPRTYEARRPLF